MVIVFNRQPSLKRKATKPFKAPNIVGILKRKLKAASKPKAGRPSKIEEREKFKGLGVSETARPQSGKEEQPLSPIDFANTIKSLVKQDPIHRAQQLSEDERRDRFIRGKRREAESFLESGDLMPSSFVEELDYVEEDNSVHVNLDGRQYTFFNVPVSVFNRWFEGQATCTTDAPGGWTGRNRKLWTAGKTPSLGAFFNQYIKNRYRYMRGYF